VSRTMEAIVFEACMCNNMTKKKVVSISRVTMKDAKKALAAKFKDFKISSGRVYGSGGVELGSDTSLLEYCDVSPPQHVALVLSGPSGWEASECQPPQLTVSNVCRAEEPRTLADWTLQLKAAAPPLDLLNAARSTRKEGVVLFWNDTDENGYLSNWKRTLMLVGDECYTSVEQYIMAEKARCSKNGTDKAALREIMKSRSPREMKKIGRQLNLDKKEWNRNRGHALRRGTEAKFRYNRSLAIGLLQTGSKALAEASPSDTMFGIGLAPSDPKAQLQECWKGQNLLGEALETVREKLRGEILAVVHEHKHA